jgi:hypothetical protein
MRQGPVSYRRAHELTREVFPIGIFV